VHVQAEGDAPLEGDLRVVGRVHVDRLLELQPAVLVVDHAVDHAVADGLGAHKLGGRRVLERQLGGDVGELDARVRRADLAQTCLDHIVAQAAA